MRPSRYSARSKTRTKSACQGLGIWVIAARSRKRLRSLPLRSRASAQASTRSRGTGRFPAITDPRYAWLDSSSLAGSATRTNALRLLNLLLISGFIIKTNAESTLKDNGPLDPLKISFDRNLKESIVRPARLRCRFF